MKMVLIVDRPHKKIVMSVEKNVPGRKLPKERLTVMVCSNALGKLMLKLLVVVKFKKNMDNKTH